MMMGAYLTGENGQSHHASRLTWVTCLLTLHFCIAYTHATTASIEKKRKEKTFRRQSTEKPSIIPGSCPGAAYIIGSLAAVVYSEPKRCTEKALKATQNASQIAIADTLKDFARESYDRCAYSWAAEYFALVCFEYSKRHFSSSSIFF